MGIESPSKAQRARLRRSLLAWYRRQRRPLPWRESPGPYGIWVSEVMLQQTTVAVVTPRWKRFLARFPSVTALARATERSVLAEWSGLGYYSRARNLHRAARAIERSGSFPRTVEGLRSLPGIGDYTAAAVASIAFGVPAAVVDGNVARVLCRIFALPLDPKRPENLRRLKEIAASLLSTRSPGAFNQAMMELGATVCVPRNPRCLSCPVRASCQAFARGNPEAYPLASSRSRVERVTLDGVITSRGGRLVLVPDAHFVKGARHLTIPLFAAPRRAARSTRDLLRKWKDLTGRDLESLIPLGEVRHSVLNRRYSILLHLGVEKGRETRARVELEGSGVRFALVRPGDVSRLARGGFLEKAVALWIRARDKGGSRLQAPAILPPR